MNYLQIWIGNKPDNDIINCMKSVIKNVKQDDIYILISSKVWKFVEEETFGKNFKWIDVEKYKEKLLDHKHIKKIWHLVPKENKFWFMADLIRYYYLSKNEHTLYLDTDIELSFKYDKNVMDIDKTYFGKFGNTLYDCNVMYNGNNLDLFEHILKVSINNIINGNKSIDRLWAVRFINIKRTYNQINNIPFNYIHLNNNSKIKV